MKCTDNPEALHTAGVEEVTEVLPSPVVATVAVKLPPKEPDDGKLEMAGGVGVATLIAKLCGLPFAAA